MRVLVIASVLLIGVLALVFGLLSVFRDLIERFSQSDPVFRDSGPIFHDPDGASQQTRSQFAWQSRSHFRERD
jgi:hypothetical protein